MKSQIRENTSGRMAETMISVARLYRNRIDRPRKKALPISGHRGGQHTSDRTKGMPCGKSLAGKAFKEGWLRGLEPPTLRSTI
jgi:hypothetical protein